MSYNVLKAIQGFASELIDNLKGNEEHLNQLFKLCDQLGELNNKVKNKNEINEIMTALSNDNENSSECSDSQLIRAEISCYENLKKLNSKNAEDELSECENPRNDPLEVSKKSIFTNNNDDDDDDDDIEILNVVKFS